MKSTDNNEKKEKRGLYFALAICLVAVGIAAWGTYNSVSEYLTTQDLARENTLSIPGEDPEAPAGTNPVSEPEKTATPEPTQVPDPKPAPPEEPAPDEAEEVNAPLYSLRETFISPLASTKITAPFSGDELVYNETMRDWRVHHGQDIAAEKGQSVFAANNGVVTSVFNDLLLGNVIVIEHGEYEFWYCGLGDTFLVSEGDIVTSAKTIGSVTTVPSESQSLHLHLQVCKDGAFIDPAELAFS